MNTGCLNVYKVSGIPTGTVGEVTDYGRYKYWTAGTTTILNTIAFNEQLSDVNVLVAELSVCDASERVSILNDIDYHLLIIEALAGIDQYGADKLGFAINAMLKEGKLDADITDDQERAEHLDKLVVEMQQRATKQKFSDVEDSEFLQYWYGTVLSQNYNNVPQDIIDRYAAYFKTKEGVGAVNPNDYDTVEDYVEAAGPGMLYLFLPNPEKYSYTIQMRVKQAKKNYDYVQKNIGYLSDDAVMNMSRTGIIKEYKMTPEKKLAYLQEYGDKYLIDGTKVGIATETVMMWLQIISVAVGILVSLFAMIKDVFVVTYEQPINYDDAIPQTDDWNLPENENTGVSGFLSKYGIFVAGGALLLLLSGDKK